MSTSGQSALFARATQQAGSHRQKSSSLSALVSTLVPCLALAAVYVGVFLLLRNKQKRVYAPRTFHDALSHQEKTPAPKQGILNWTKDFLHISDEYIISHHSLDGYLYVRFLKMMVFMSFIGCLITWPVLFPVNATGGGGESGLDIISFSNVQDPTRYFAHALIAWVFFGFIMFLIWRELTFLIKIRQAYLLSAWNASRISQRTVLFTNVPEAFLPHAKLHSTFESISQIWLVTDTSDLEDDVDELNDSTLKLEGAEGKLIQQSVKQYHKKDSEKGPHNESGSLSWDKILEKKDRPTHKLKPLIGKKVDTIDYSTKQLKELLPKVSAVQRSHLEGKEKQISAVFIEFETMRAAQVAYSLEIHDKPAKLVARQFGILPEEVIWKNLKMSAPNRAVRLGLATAAIYALILFWSIPVALVGIISNVNYLTTNVPFLGWINSIPKVILGVVTGLLPTILLAVLMALVPIICRFLATLAGAVSLSEVELQTQSWYFAFQVIQVFLITTFTSGATAVASQIVSNPAAAVPLLAKNLPKASNFYISYFILYGVASSAAFLINIGGLAGVFILSKFAKTPRKKYEKWMALTSPAWGSEYPKWTNLGVIAISYAVIAPLVLGFATVGMGLIYLAYRYNMLYVHNTVIDTKGACYARALQQLMVGVYLAELCLLGLFGIGIGSRTTAVGPVVLQVILIVATIVFHVMLRKKLGPLLATLPLNLLEESEHNLQGYSNRVERGEADAGKHHTTQNKQHPSFDAHNDAALHSNGKETFETASGSPNSRSTAAIHTNTASNDIGSNTSPPHRSLLQRLFAPHTQSPEAMSASLHPRFREPVSPYEVEDAREAYMHPALTQRPPIIWLARDGLGVSQREVESLRGQLGGMGAEVTDEGASVDEKGGVVWDEVSVREAPLWEGKVVY